MGRAILNVESLAISEREAKELAASIVRVSELYDLPLLDEKTRAWLGLGMTMASVYGTRIGAWYIGEERKRKERRAAAAAAKQAGPEMVYPMAVGVN
jgi:hypothetical protein